MNETAWFNATDAYPMLKFLRRRAGGWFTRNQAVADRQLRLFGVACCRNLWHFLGDHPGCVAVCISERYADGQASKDELRRARELMRSQPGVRWWRGWLSRVYTFQMHEVWLWTEGMAWAVAAGPDGLWREIARLAWVAGPDGPLGLSLELVDGMPSPGLLLRDIIFNPFKRPPTIPDSVLAWNDRCIVKMARTLYDENDFSQERMAVLADALEEAGITDEEVLGHCRQKGVVHVRGCWVVDLLLGKT
jgi:hypothetical protein